MAVSTALGGLLLPLTSASPAAAAERADTTTRVSAPGSVPAGSTAEVSVRLLEGRAYVDGATVDVQVPTGSGWRTVARTTTDSRGLGSVSLRVSNDTPVRAHYRGSEARQAATSAADRIEVRSTRSSDRVDVRSTRSSSRVGGSVLSEAARHNGKPYRYGSTGPSSFDCSGFTAYVYKQATGKTLPHNARRQEAVSQRVSKSQARPGDLVFIQDVAGHVGIYAGDGKMWDAPRSGKTVSLRRIWTSNYTIGRV